MANYIVLKMDLNDKWWDKWFVVGGLSIDRSIKLHHYNYFSMSSVYMLTQGDVAKKEFFVRKPRRNLRGFWSKLDIIGVIDDFGGLLSEVSKFCGDNICCDMGQNDTIGKIELNPSIVLSSDNTNCKNDIQLFHQLFDELSVYRDYH